MPFDLFFSPKILNIIENFCKKKGSLMCVKKARIINLRMTRKIIQKFFDSFS